MARRRGYGKEEGRHKASEGGGFDQRTEGRARTRDARGIYAVREPRASREPLTKTFMIFFFSLSLGSAWRKERRKKNKNENNNAKKRPGEAQLNARASARDNTHATLIPRLSSLTICFAAWFSFVIVTPIRIARRCCCSDSERNLRASILPHRSIANDSSRYDGLPSFVSRLRIGRTRMLKYLSASLVPNSFAQK